MANKNLFATKRIAPVANATNDAGGRAYSLDNKNALAQLVVTGTLNGTFYADAKTQLDRVLELVNGCDVEFIAKAAVYGHEVARMKDSPVLLLAVLANRGEAGLVYLRKIFPRVITNQRQLRSFVQIVRSGATGRKSFGTAIKREIQSWLRQQDANYLFKGAVGNSPSLADVVKLVHPRPKNVSDSAFYRWLLGKHCSQWELPDAVAEFEAFKRNPVGPPPAVDFRMLSSLKLTSEQWASIAIGMPWNALRMNLNTLLRNGAFNIAGVADAVAKKLSNSDEVTKSNAFPYQLLTTYQNVEAGVPAKVKNALQAAMEVATGNVPRFDVGGVAVAVDVSGSMQSAVTGNRPGSTTRTKCVDVAALFAASILRNNKNAIVIPFDTAVRPIELNPYDSIMTNASRLSINGGGTDCGTALRHLNSLRANHDLIIYVSDNESWVQAARSSNQRLGFGWSHSTGMADEWLEYNRRNKNAKLALIDLQPNNTTQVQTSPNVLNIGGFSDAVFNVVNWFAKHGRTDVAGVIDNVELDTHRKSCYSGSVE